MYSSFLLCSHTNRSSILLAKPLVVKLDVIIAKISYILTTVAFFCLLNIIF